MDENFKTEFNSIREKLQRTLETNKLKGGMYQSIKGMYYVVKAKERVGDKVTVIFMCQGLTQGEVCCPLLFASFIDELAFDIINGGKQDAQLPSDIIEICILSLAGNVVLISDTVSSLQKQTKCKKCII